MYLFIIKRIRLGNPNEASAATRPKDDSFYNGNVHYKMEGVTCTHTHARTQARTHTHTHTHTHSIFLIKLSTPSST